MKNLIMSLAVAVLTTVSIQAQENKTIKEESTVERIITKEGNAVKVKEMIKTDTEAGALMVRDNNKTNQEFREVNNKDTEKRVLMDDVRADVQNEAMIAQKKLEEKALLEASKKNQLEMAAKKRLEYEAKQELKQKELADRKAKLTARPKGMSKLKKD